MNFGVISSSPRQLRICWLSHVKVWRVAASWVSPSSHRDVAVFPSVAVLVPAGMLHTCISRTRVLLSLLLHVVASLSPGLSPGAVTSQPGVCRAARVLLTVTCGPASRLPGAFLIALCKAGLNEGKSPRPHPPGGARLLLFIKAWD